MHLRDAAVVRVLVAHEGQVEVLRRARRLERRDEPLAGLQPSVLGLALGFLPLRDQELSGSKLNGGTDCSRDGSLARKGGCG